MWETMQSTENNARKFANLIREGEVKLISWLLSMYKKRTTLPHVALGSSSENH